MIVYYLQGIGNYLMDEVERVACSRYGEQPFVYGGLRYFFQSFRIRVHLSSFYHGN